MRKAFTLVELLVVIGVIGILISILLPVILRSKRHAEAAAGTANLRSLSQIMGMYTTDNGEAFLNPYGGASDYRHVRSVFNPEIEWSFNAHPLCPECSTEGFSLYWYSYLADVEDQPRFRDEQFSPADAWMRDLRKAMGKRDETRQGLMLWPSSFVYPPVFYSDSGRFPGGLHTEATSGNVRTQFSQSVAYPSKKVLLFERADFDQRDRITVSDTGGSTRVGRPPAWNNIRSHTAVATVDGGVQEVDMSELYGSSDQALIPLGQASGSDRPGLVRPVGMDEIPSGAGGGGDGGYPAFFLLTVNGIEGRDLPN